LLPLLQLLLLLSMFLRQLFGLLLMLLFERLLFRFIGRLLWKTLMILLLSRLECLAFSNLLRLELVLLLLVFPIRIRVAGVGSGDVLRRGNISGMDCGARAIGLSGGASSFRGRAIRIRCRAIRIGGRTGRLRVGTVVVLRCGRGVMNRATFSGSYRSAFFEGAGPGCGSDGGLALVRGSA